MAISPIDMKILFGKSAGRCNICGVEVFDESVVVGQMAHVIAQKPRGPRGDNLYCGNIDSIDNIILLCLKHHKIVDSKPVEYPPERLYAIKNTFEGYVKARLDVSFFRMNDILALNCLFKYIPFLNMLMYIERLPDMLDLDFLSFIEHFETFSKTNSHIYPFHDQDLQLKFDNLRDIQYKLHCALSGIQGAAIYTSPVLIENRYVAHLNKNIIVDQQLQEFQRYIAMACELYPPVYNEFMVYVKNFYPEVHMNQWVPISPLVV